MNRAPSAAAEAQTAKLRALVQPQSCPLTMASTSSADGEREDRRPSMSGIRRRPGARLSTSSRRVRAIATMPIGTLTRKTRRQSLADRGRPQRGADAGRRGGDRRPQATAWARCSASKAASTSASDEGMRKAAANACSTRKAISRPSEGAPAQSADAEREDPEREQEHPAAPEQVGDPPGGHEERREDDVVGAQHPRHRGDARLRERALDARERDVDDRRVDERDEDPERCHREHGPRGGRPASSQLRDRRGKRGAARRLQPSARTSSMGLAPVARQRLVLSRRDRLPAVARPLCQIGVAPSSIARACPTPTCHRRSPASRARPAGPSAARAWRRRRVVLLVAVALFATGDRSGVLRPASAALHRGANDRRALLRPRPRTGAPGDIAIVGIDDATFNYLRSHGLPSQWPFPRRDEARVIDNLHRAGARVIAMDIQFTEPSLNPADDQALATAIAEPGMSCSSPTRWAPRARPRSSAATPT